MKNVIDIETHLEVCQEYEEKIDDLNYRLSDLKEDYDDFKENLINEFESMKCREYDERDENYNYGIDVCIGIISNDE
nr:MAG TPA: hypothetical protein [Caudoviricetes sp.]